MISMARNFKELLVKRSPESRARIKALADRYKSEMALDELRVAHQMTQQNLADLMGMNQASLSKMERQTDMYISSLRSIIRAMGGYLLLEAVFPDGRVAIKQFSDLKESEQESEPNRPAKNRSRSVKRRLTVASAEG
jgi:transcriptional regulator with XRE-family HTH domain